MTAVNWHLFQATATLIAGELAGSQPPVSQLAFFEAVDKRFLNLYRGLEKIAQKIEADQIPSEYQSQSPSQA